ncbi:hypothetical protein EDB89DRAFT_1985669 [Lactarius sanguifluus]|nr:hypothetical protein EDB89DRAFT_1985669 [Lactarius sanguifluus]
MSYSQTATSDPYTFSVWPDASAASEEDMTMLAQAAGCTQPGLTVEEIFFDDLLDATLAVGSSSATPAETFGSHKNSDWTTGGTVAADMPPHPNATAMSTTTTLAPTTFPLADDMDAYTQEFFFPPFVSMRQLAVLSKCSSCYAAGLVHLLLSLTDVSSLPSPRGDGTRNGTIPFSTFGAASSYIVSASNPTRRALLTEVYYSLNYHWWAPHFPDSTPLGLGALIRSLTRRLICS